MSELIKEDVNAKAHKSDELHKIASMKELLKELRAPFSKDEISWLPKPTKAQTDAVKQDFKKGVRCDLCGGWHHPQVVHLEYVGHAAVTNRLLNVDPLWNWDFLHVDEFGQPILDKNGGMWITLTVLGVTRKGYGDATGKQGANAVKEMIGDAIRNAGMRFGIALELWHKGSFDRDLYPSTNAEKEEPAAQAFTECSDDDFNKRLETWTPRIESGEQTAQTIKDYLNSKGFALTPAQYQKLQKIKVK